jgi:hypothetical protein
MLLPPPPLLLLLLPPPPLLLLLLSCHPTAWFNERKYLQPSALHAEILSRSGRGQLEVAALTHLIRTAASPRDAALALSAVSAVRHVGIGQGRVAPWPDAFLKAFIKVGREGEGEGVRGREGCLRCLLCGTWGSVRAGWCPGLTRF